MAFLSLFVLFRATLFCLFIGGMIGGTNAIQQSLGDFAASMVNDAQGSDVTLVSGNEGGDADSIITALTYAYLLSVDGSEDEDDQCVPCNVLNGTKPVSYIKFVRADMLMRPETEIIMRNAGVDPSDLVYKEDPAAPGLLANTTQLVLTDHNQVDAELSGYGDKVIQILDHHTDLQDHLQVTGDDRKIAFDETSGKALVASACTVICETYLKNPNGYELLGMNNGTIAQVLMSVILIDGGNKLESDGGKLTERDTVCLDVLHNITGLHDEESTALYEELIAAKTNQTLWDSVTAAQILGYDFKVFTSSNGKYTVGISESQSSLKSLSSREDWVDSLEERAEQYDLYIVMTQITKPDGSKERELLLTACTDELVDAAAEYFTSYDDVMLELEPIVVVPVPNYSRAFDQQNTGPSRKQIAPISQEFLDTLTEDPNCDIDAGGESATGGDIDAGDESITGGSGDSDSVDENGLESSSSAAAAAAGSMIAFTKPVILIALLVCM